MGAVGQDHQRVGDVVKEEAASTQGNFESQTKHPRKLFSGWKLLSSVDTWLVAVILLLHTSFLFAVHQSRN